MLSIAGKGFYHSYTEEDEINPEDFAEAFAAAIYLISRYFPLRQTLHVPLGTAGAGLPPGALLVPQAPAFPRVVLPLQRTSPHLSHLYKREAGKPHLGQVAPIFTPFLKPQ